MSKFQLITLAIFILAIVGGVIAFATYKSKSATDALPAITIWGIFPKATFDAYVSQINNSLAAPVTIKYVQETAESFPQDFIAALADGTGPDAILIPADMILPQENKLDLIPYSAFSQRDYLDTYIDEAQIYATPNGIMALPFMVDPLVMYWNRDSFDAAGIAAVPQYWSDFSAIIPKLTTKDANGNIRKSAIALGDFTTVDNAREILGTLFLQLGNPITQTASDGSVASTIKVSAAVDPTPAIQFFTQFADPTNADYSWNRGQPDSKTAFLSGTLATYFGFASELSDIRAKNPNLNFDVAALPQLKTGGTAATYGQLFGFSIVHSTPNPNAVYQILSILTAPQSLAGLAQSLYLPSVRRDVIAQGSTDPYISIFDKEALIAKTWLDASPDTSNQIFGSMIQSVTSGQDTIFQAIQTAGAQYDAALEQAMQ